MRQHYHVSTFQPGCLNDADAGPFATKRAAQTYLKELAQEYRDQGHEVRGNAHDGYTVFPHFGVVGWRLVLDECEDPDCIVDEN